MVRSTTLANTQLPNFHVSISKLILLIRLLFHFNVCHIVVPIVTCPEVDLESQSKHVDHMVPGFHLNDSSNGNHGFTLLGEGETPTLSHQMKVIVYTYNNVVPVLFTYIICFICFNVGYCQSI